jgi:hypothetical protein
VAGLRRGPEKGEADMSLDTYGTRSMRWYDSCAPDHLDGEEEERGRVEREIDRGDFLLDEWRENEHIQESK